jgi:serine protease Do
LREVNKKIVLALVVAAFVLGGLILPNLEISWRGSTINAQTGGPGLGVQPGAPQNGLQPEEVYARAAQAAYKSVVNIDAVQQVRVRPNIFDEFFGESQPRFENSTSQGSGVIIDKSGYILTNEHVVGAAQVAGRQITVTMTDGRKLSGTVIGADHVTDLALVKVEGKDLPAAQIGTVRGLVQGQLSVAIGNPFGLRFTVSHGVISALGRPIQGPEGRIYSDLIQHDALINPGNSGGALVDIQGRLIGINTLVDPRAQGIGFAIPIDTALKVADELKRFGKIRRPWLGLVTDTNNPIYVRRYGLADTPGAVLRGLYRGSPNADTGLEPGDVITKMGGSTVKSDDDFKAAERKLKIGQKVDVDVARGDRRLKATLVVGEAP